MSLVRVRPAKAMGTVQAPPSKSYTHRALVVGYLAGRGFEVRHPLDSEDTRATAAALGRLGSSVSRSGDVWTVERRREPAARRKIRIDCRESGTTLRFVCALAGLGHRPVRITGSDRLSERPLDELLVALEELGARCRRTGARRLPVEIQGPLHSGSVMVDASLSSQFASALLFVLPGLSGDSRLRLTGRTVSRPYIDATLAVLAHEGVRVKRRGREIRIPGSQGFRGRSFLVPGDASSASYFWAAAAMTRGRVRVRGIPPRWPQADLSILPILRRYGAVVREHEDGATVVAGSCRPLRVDFADCPDLFPLVGVLSATAPGTSHLEGAEHVALKESDRRVETARVVRAIGGNAKRSRTGLTIRGTARPRALHLERLSDHRIVMSAAVAALAANRDSILGDAEAVRKSFPRFWKVLGSISGGAMPR